MKKPNKVVSRLIGLVLLVIGCILVPSRDLSNETFVDDRLNILTSDNKESLQKTLKEIWVQHDDPIYVVTGPMGCKAFFDKGMQYLLIRDQNSGYCEIHRRSLQSGWWRGHRHIEDDMLFSFIDNEGQAYEWLQNRLDYILVMKNAQKKVRGEFRTALPSAFVVIGFILIAGFIVYMLVRRKS